MTKYFNFFKNFCINFFTKLFILTLFFLIFAFFLFLPNFYNFFIKSNFSINVYTPIDMITQEVAEDFYKKTGISINLKYFDTPEELFAQFKINKGTGYDLVIVPDNIIEFLVKGNLLKKIDLSKISNFINIDKKLLGYYFDKNNDYSVPYVWSVDGIVFKKNLLNQYNFKIGWDLIFKKPMLFDKEKGIFEDIKICTINSARESVALAAIYLFEKSKNLTIEELDIIQNLLMKQKNWVEVYMLGSLQYYMLGDVVSLAVTSSAYARKLMEQSDLFDFILPDSGSILFIDNFAIPAVSKKTDIVYKFIDFLLSKEILIKNSNAFGYNPANILAYDYMPVIFKNNKSILPDEQMFKKLHILSNQIDNNLLEKIWLMVKLN